MRRETYEDLTARDVDELSPVRIGLLGRGTVGGAFAELLAERADAVEAATGPPAGDRRRADPRRGRLRRDPRRAPT